MSIAGHVHAPEQIISLDQALRANTIDATFGLRREQEIGSLEAGKLRPRGHAHLLIGRAPQPGRPGSVESPAAILFPIPDDIPRETRKAQG